MTENITLREIAAETNTQPYQIAALLDLGTDYSDDMALEPWMVEVVRNTTDAGTYEG